MEHKDGVWRVTGHFSHIPGPVTHYNGNDFQQACTCIGQAALSYNIQTIIVYRHGEEYRNLAIKEKKV